MEVREHWDYDEFPEPAEVPAEAVRIATTGDEDCASYVPDVVYATRDGRELHLQLVLPDNRNSRLAHERGGARALCPCLVYVQGSGWAKQNCYHAVPKVARLASHGIAVAIVEYREAEVATFPAQVMDAQRAMRFLSRHGDAFGIDPERLVIGGCSSGGHTAVFAALLADEKGRPASELPVSGIIDLYGAVSFMRADGYPTTTDSGSPESPEGQLMGGDLRANCELRAKGSAEAYIGEETPLPPVLIAHGTKDRMVSCEVSIDFYRHLRATGHDAELVLLEGADHGGSEFFADPVVSAYERFIRRCVG